MVTQDEREYWSNTQPRENRSDSRKTTGTIDSSWPEPLAPEALQGLAGDIVESISQVTEADPAATLGHLLAAFGSAIGAGPHLPIMHNRHPARLFLVLVGDSAKGRKGSSWSEPRTLFELADPVWTKRVHHGGLSSGEGLIWAVRDERWERQPVREKGRVVDYQEVCVDEGESDKRLMVIEEEFANLLAVMKREGNTVSPVVRQAWDHGNLAPMTKNVRISATGAHISIVGHVTRDELRARIDDVAMVNGFANRFLWLAVRRAKLLPWGGGLSDEGVGFLSGELGNAIAFASRLDAMALDTEARDLWESIYHRLSEGKPGLLGAALARAEPQVLRLSLCYALMDRSDVVRAEHLLAAVAVWDYVEASAKWIFGDLTGDSVTDTLISALRQAADAGLDGTQLHAIFNRNQSAGRIKQVLDGLIARGSVTPKTEETGERGRPRTVYVWQGI